MGRRHRPHRHSGGTHLAGRRHGAGGGSHILNAKFIRVNARDATVHLSAYDNVDVVQFLPGDVSLGVSDVEVREPSGALTAGENSTPITLLEPFSVAVVRLDVTTLTLPDADDEVHFFLQTSYNGGADWADVESRHFTNPADDGQTYTEIFVIGDPQASSVVRGETDGTLGLQDDPTPDDSLKLDLPLGDRIRFRTTLTGATAPTYAYAAQASFKSKRK